MTIYYLSDSRSNQPFYIGATNNAKNRLGKHISESKNLKQIRHTKIKALIESGAVILINEIDVVEKSEWGFWEQHYISLFRSWGFDLANQQIGGRCGSTGYKYTDEARKNMSDNRKGKGIPYTKIHGHTEESKRLMSINMKGRKAWNKGIPRTDEVKRKLRLANLGRKDSLETRERKRIATTLRWSKIKNNYLLNTFHKTFLKY